MSNLGLKFFHLSWLELKNKFPWFSLVENSLTSSGTSYLLVHQINEALFKWQMKKAKKKKEESNGERMEKEAENIYLPSISLF